MRSVEILIDMSNVPLGSLSPDEKQCFCCCEFHDIDKWWPKEQADRPVSFTCAQHEIDFQVRRISLLNDIPFVTLDTIILLNNIPFVTLGTNT